MQLNVQPATANQLAKLFGVSPRTVRDWTAREWFPRPVLESKEGKLFDVVEVLQSWYKAFSSRRGNSKLSPPELARINANATLTELRAKKFASEHIPVEDAVEVMETTNGIIMDCMSELPQRIAPQLVGLTDPNEISELLEAEIERGMVDISNQVAAKHQESLI